MLVIEYTHKRAKIFRIELGLVVLGILGLLFMVWQALSILRIIK